MSDNVVAFRPEVVGDGAKIDCDQILDVAKGKYVRLALVGETEEGVIEVAGSDSAAESLMLLQWASHFLVQNQTVR